MTAGAEPGVAIEPGGATEPGAAIEPAGAILELVGVGKEYPGSPPVAALTGVDLVVRPGELLAIVGPSGSGKSTLLHLMGTLERPTSGTISMNGVEISGLGDRQLARVRAGCLGFVFQQFFLLDGRSALDNVADGLLYNHVGRRRRRERAAQILDRVGMGHRLQHHPAQLSGGERQRVAIARALVNEPDLVLADEPTGNLDSGSAEAVLELVEDLNAGGTTIAIITHDLDVADRMPRRVSLRDGRIQADVLSHRSPPRSRSGPDPRTCGAPS